MWQEPPWVRLCREETNVMEVAQQCPCQRHPAAVGRLESEARQVWMSQEVGVIHGRSDGEFPVLEIRGGICSFEACWSSCRS